MTARVLVLAAIALIKSFESCKLTAYQDQVGIWTIGWGHTGSDVYEGLVITQAQADALLERDLEIFIAIVVAAVTFPVNDNQFGAIVSFVFNVGPGKQGVKDGFVHLYNGEPSTMLKLINAGKLADAALQFPHWNRAGGRACDGLTRRRLAEQALFNS